MGVWFAVGGGEGEGEEGVWGVGMAGHGFDVDVVGIHFVVVRRAGFFVGGLAGKGKFVGGLAGKENGWGGFNVHGFAEGGVVGGCWAESGTIGVGGLGDDFDLRCYGCGFREGVFVEGVQEDGEGVAVAPDGVQGFAVDAEGEEQRGPDYAVEGQDAEEVPVGGDPAPELFRGGGDC